MATLGFVLWQVFNLGASYWLLVPQVSFNIFALSWSIYGLYNWNNAKKELKINNYQINNEKVTPFIKRKYKSLCSSYIILNWTCLSVYICGGLIILLTFIISYFHNLINLHISEFGNLFINHNDNVLFVTMWTAFATIIFFLLLQIMIFFLNHRRKNEIELFYQQDIISDELIQKYKKTANRKGLIIFLTTTIAISLIVLITWLVLRRFANKKK